MSTSIVSHRDAQPFEVTGSLPEAGVAATVFVINDDVLVLQSVESIICSSGCQAETFASVEEFLARPPVPGPSCLVLDVTAPGLKAPDFRTRVAANWIGMPIILTRGRGEVLMTVQTSKSGTIDFAAPALHGDGLLSTILLAIKCSEMALRREEANRTLRGRYESLSGRERDVMALVALGLLNKQVAHELGISEATVKAHRGKVMAKMEARSLADLVKMAAILQLINWQ